MRPASVCLLVALLAAAPARGQQDDPQTQELWSRWLEDPLDLRHASAGEIALLPWVDHEQAALIEGLAREGALRSLEDLARVPGLDPETIVALDPFVEVGPREGPPGDWVGEWSQDESFRRREASSFRRTLRVRGGRLVSALRWRDTGDLRGWARLENRLWRLGLGSLRARPATALLQTDSGARSRTAALSSRLHPPDAWAGSLSAVAPSRAVALTLGGDRVEGTLYAAWERRAAPSGWAEVRVRRDSLAWGLAASARDRVEGAAWWRRRLGTLMVRAETAGGLRAWRSAASATWAPDRWSVGLASTHAFQAKGAGNDPISALGLDREHRAWQLSVRRRWAECTLTGLLRRMQRGDPPDRERRSRWRLWLRADLDPPRVDHARARWQLHLRVGRDQESVDAAPPSPAETQARLELRRRDANLRQRLVLARRGRRGAESQAVTLQIDQVGVWRWRFAYAAAGGERSHPWAAGLPQGSLLVRWLAPGDNLVLLGAGRAQGGLRWGIWVAASWSAADAGAWEGGCSLRWTAGRSVRNGESGAKVARRRREGGVGLLRSARGQP